MSLLERLDFHGELSAQLPLPPISVVYSASGTLPAAAILEGAAAVIEHKLYGGAVGDRDEGAFLTATLNSETARARVEHLQSRGQWGARDFDKVLFSLPIPLFDRRSKLHAELVANANDAERIANEVPLGDGRHFVSARRLIRQALVNDGVAARLERLVKRLLP